MDKLPLIGIPGIYQEAEENKQQSIIDELNFKNKNSQLKRKKANEKIIQSDDLLKSAKAHRENADVEKAEADERGSVQSSLEAMELYGKSILDADEEKEIQDPKHRVDRNDLESKHNIGALNRSLRANGINLIEGKEINKIYSRLGKEENLRFPKREDGRPSYEQPYNAIRYGHPLVTNEDAMIFNDLANNVKSRYNEILDAATIFIVGDKRYRIIVDEEGNEYLELLNK